MNYRKPRIVWSVAWGAFAISLLMLWVRSYYSWADELNFIVQNVRAWHLASWKGGVSFCVANYDSTVPDAWKIYTAWDRGVFGFSALVTTNSTSYRIPYWLPLFGLVSLAGIPWLRWPNRFSLRSMLIAVTIAAVTLGLVLYS